VNTEPLEWFRCAGDVPGVDWSTPEGAIPDRRLAEARPIADPGSYSPLGVAWIDGAGEPIADDYRNYMSPAELVLEGRWQIGDPNKAVRMMCQSLALPGRRSDYHEALSWLPSVEGAPGAWVELALRADVQLVLADPPGALISPWAVKAGLDSDVSSQASQPILRLINFYLTEGFLLEAADAERLLDRLSEAARPRHEYWTRPADVASALAGLAG